jgi:hypothetical protein
MQPVVGSFWFVLLHITNYFQCYMFALDVNTGQLLFMQTVFLDYHIYITLSCINVLGLVMGTVKESEQGLSLVTTDPSIDIPNMVTAAPLKTSTISQ